MKPETRDAFIPFTDPLEGKTNFLYTDEYGLVTTGRGNLVDWGPRRLKGGDPIGTCDPSPAMALGWKNADSTLSIAKVIRSAWWVVKNAWPAFQSFACANLTTIRLDPIDVDTLTYTKLDSVWQQIVHRWPDAESWSAPAQLGVISMAWAMGAGFDFPKFAYGASQKDWSLCAGECKMSNGSPLRNAQNWELFTGAAAGLTIAQSLSTPAPAA
jgi:GH24 family phage-related lysozyme (muramidase)